MKFLALLFLVGFALAAAVPLPSNENEVAYESAVDDFFQDLTFEADDDIKTELGKKLREHLDDILEKIKEAIDHGKGVKADYLEKMKEIRQKLKDLKIDIGNKARELLDKVKDKAKNYWEKIKEILDLVNPNPKERSLEDFEDVFAADDDIKTELGKKLKEHLDDILEKIKEAIEHGKGVKEDTLEKMKEIRQKLKDLKIDIGNKAKELLDKLKDKAKDYWKKILDILNPETRSLEHIPFAAEDDITAELGKKLRERFDEIMEKVKEAIEQGKGVKEETLEKLKEIREKLKNLRIDLGDKAKELLEKLKDKAKDYWQKILDKIAGKEKRNIDDLNLKEVFKKLKDLIKSKIDKEALKERIEKIFGKGSDMADELLRVIREKGEKGKKKILDFIDRILGEKEGKRSIKEVYEKLKDYFRDLNIELKEKFAKFGEYVKEKYEQGLEKGKTRVENLKKIASKFLEDTKDISRDVAREALEFFREYKEDLGRVYDDIRVKVKEIVNRDQ